MLSFPMYEHDTIYLAISWFLSLEICSFEYTSPVCTRFTSKSFHFSDCKWHHIFMFIILMFIAIIQK